MTYKGNSRHTLSYMITYNSKFYESYNSLIDNIIRIFETNFVNLLKNYHIENFSSFDKMLLNIYENASREDQNTKSIVKILSNAISISAYVSQSIIQEIPFNNFIFNNFKDNVKYDEKVPNLGLGIFKCGKSSNSKVKYERFFLIINNQHKYKRADLENLFIKIYNSIRKVLTTGKHGVRHHLLLFRKMV